MKIQPYSLYALLLSMFLVVPHPMPAISFEGGIDTHMHIDGVSREGGGMDDRRGRRGPSFNRKHRSGGKPLDRRPDRRSRRGTIGGERDYPAAATNLIKLMDEYGVEKAIVMPPPQNKNQLGAYDYKSLQSALALFPNRLYLGAGGGTLNPMIQSVNASDVDETIKYKFRKMAETIVRAGAVSFGEMTAMHLCMNPRHHYVATSPDHPLFLLLADIAAKHGIPIDMHMEAIVGGIDLPMGLERCEHNPDYVPGVIVAFERLLTHNRDAKIVWQHIGWDNTGGMTPQLIRRLLKKHPNLYASIRVEDRPVMVGTDIPMPNRVVDNRGRFKAEWLALFVDFPDRFMIGVDEFMGVKGRSPIGPRSFSDTWKALGSAPVDLQEKMGKQNARSVYRLR